MSIHSEFKPELTPKQMLELGVFEGNYFSGNYSELPDDWLENAKISPDSKPDPLLNYYEIAASQPLKIWQEKGWINPQDPLGWFQWYCRYTMGRRSDDDERQIKRWKAIRRHIGQIKKNCIPGDQTCRMKQRQALLHWAYDARKL